LLTFVRVASREGTEPLIVYFPSRGDFLGQDRSGKDAILRILRRSRVDVIDLTSCVGQLGAERAFIRNRPHYTAEGNAAVARCLVPVVLDRLPRVRSRSAATLPPIASPSPRR
jgi:hypothetical protein